MACKQHQEKCRIASAGCSNDLLLSRGLLPDSSSRPAAAAAWQADARPSPGGSLFGPQLGEKCQGRGPSKGAAAGCNRCIVENPVWLADPCNDGGSILPAQLPSSCRDGTGERRPPLHAEAATSNCKETVRYSPVPGVSLSQRHSGPPDYLRRDPLVVAMVLRIWLPHTPARKCLWQLPKPVGSTERHPSRRPCRAEPGSSWEPLRKAREPARP